MDKIAPHQVIVIPSAGGQQEAVAARQVHHQLSLPLRSPCHTLCPLPSASHRLLSCASWQEDDEGREDGEAHQHEDRPEKADNTVGAACGTISDHGPAGGAGPWADSTEDSLLRRESAASVSPEQRARGLFTQPDRGGYIDTLRPVAELLESDEDFPRDSRRSESMYSRDSRRSGSMSNSLQATLPPRPKTTEPGTRARGILLESPHTSQGGLRGGGVVYCATPATRPSRRPISQILSRLKRWLSSRCCADCWLVEWLTGWLAE